MLSLFLGSWSSPCTREGRRRNGAISQEPDRGPSRFGLFISAGCATSEKASRIMTTRLAGSRKEAHFYGIWTHALSLAWWLWRRRRRASRDRRRRDSLRFSDFRLYHGSRTTNGFAF